MKPLVKYIVILLLLSSCGGSKLVSSKTVKDVKRDSITTITYKPKKDTIRIKADSLKLLVPIKDLTEKPIIKTSESGRTKASVRQVNGTVEVQCFTEEYEAIIESQDKIIETLLKITQSQDTTNTVQVKESPWYMKALAFIGIASLIGFVFTLIKSKPF
ncbi:hypothetical protein [Yeosuana marina]|uniref:hypothetical protein n=1 Tax=Yeosuana marina TaxID=1565536 RepID=UPI001421FB63|nr:hypothetical protein [Yeosuana marina]